jgi:hypothetical protein
MVLSKMSFLWVLKFVDCLVLQTKLQCTHYKIFEQQTTADKIALISLDFAFVD